jgi:hypothetical protein
VIVGAALSLATAALAGCSTYGKKSAPPPPAPVNALAKTADVPVGAGVILGASRPLDAKPIAVEGDSIVPA